MHLFTVSRNPWFYSRKFTLISCFICVEFLRRQWSEFSHVIHSSLFLLAFFRPFPSTFTADASKNEGHFLASRARCSLNLLTRRIFVPFPSRLPPQLRRHWLEQRSFRLSMFIDSYVDRCANDSSLFYSSRHIFLSPILQAKRQFIIRGTLANEDIVLW